MMANRAIKVAEQILKLSTFVTDEQIEEALSKISAASSTYGVMWGFDGRSGSNLDFIEMKGEVLKFLQSLRKNKSWAVSALIPIESLVEVE